MDSAGAALWQRPQIESRTFTQPDMRLEPCRELCQRIPRPAKPHRASRCRDIFWRLPVVCPCGRRL